MVNPLIGTSGWQYAHWNGKFYPETVKGTSQLPYYTTHFNTVEINSTFYNTPKPESAQRWYESTPDDFQFSVKMNKYLTHTKLLKWDTVSEERLRSFLSSLIPLGDKLTVILIQCPPRMKKDLTKLELFFENLRDIMEEMNFIRRVAIEFRHGSWFDRETFDTLKFYNVANVQSDGASRWPISYQTTANFGYVRLHGSKKLYASLYTQNELEQWKAFMNFMMKGFKDVYVYFDNDGSANAIKNAQQLKKLFTN